MATIYAIKGLILEEILLNLLKESGYIPITNINNDETLTMGTNGIEVKGRGWNHQIDAIADFAVSPPFSYPLRLLLEAKFYSSRVGIDIIRNAVGVLKDVSEYWISNNRNEISKPRYHYQYAVFTSSSFSSPAQKYAFAQDIYLIKLENNRYFLPIINSIRDLVFNDFNGTSNESISINLTEFRRHLRTAIKNRNIYYIENFCEEKRFNKDKINTIFETSQNLRYSYLGIIGQRFPIFFTPSPRFNINDLIENQTIRICWDEDMWYIIKNSAECGNLDDEDILFSFDLPKDLFQLYADNNMLSKTRALNLKEDFMSSIKITFKNEELNIMSSIELKLDSDWINDIRNHIVEER